MKFSKRIAPLLLIILLLIPASSVHADIAPPHVRGMGGLRPFVYQSTEVQMTYERVELSLQPIPPESAEDFTVKEKVDVTAWFVLQNTGASDEEMKVAFPLGNLNCYDDANKLPRSWGLQEYYIDEDSFKAASNGIVLQTENLPIEGVDCISWATFDVNFPVQKDVLIRVDYSMETSGRGHYLLLDYILETGAGWKGPIKQAYIVFRFPYLVTSGNIDASQTTPGYQSLYNEIFWSYRDLEPTPADNIFIGFFEPRAWMDIQALQEQVANTPTDSAAWSKLFAEYETGAPYDAEATLRASFENAIKTNLANPDFYAKYASFLATRCCYFMDRGRTNLPVGARENVERLVIPLLNRSFELDPQNPSALDVLQGLHYTFPDLTYTPPPTIPPAATSALSSTPTTTHLPSLTPKPSLTPVVVTVVNTRIVTATSGKRMATHTPSPTAAITSTPAAAPENTDKSGVNWLAWPLVFILGSLSGVFITKRKWI